MIGKLHGPFCLVVTRYMVGGGQTGQRGGTHGEAVPLPFAPRGTRFNLLFSAVWKTLTSRKRETHVKEIKEFLINNNTAESD